jgi:ribosomal protein L37AE/L43A
MATLKHRVARVASVIEALPVTACPSCHGRIEKAAEGLGVGRCPVCEGSPPVVVIGRPLTEQDEHRCPACGREAEVFHVVFG